MRKPPPAAAEPATPLAQGEFAALLAALGPFEQAPRLAVAVSGGPDSMALAQLTAEWAHTRAGSVLGLIVDHGLRPESAAEATRVAEWLRRADVPSRILAWTGAKPATGIQAAARAARLDLLCAACRAEAILHLLLAQQRDEQAETVLMRGDSGSGAAGLAGIAAVREVLGLRLLRPLLAVSKARLTATLAATGQPWLVDPANADVRYARGRLRADPAFAREEAWARGLTHAVARCQDDDRIAAWLARVARPHRLGFVRIAVGAWGEIPAPLRPALLGRLLATVAGRSYPVARKSVENAASPLLPAPATLGGCIIVRRGDDLLICREPGRIRHRLALPVGAQGQWDARFALRHERGLQSVEVRALGATGARMLAPEVRSRLRLAAVPALALHGQPAAWAGTALVACPPLEAFGLCTQAGFSITAALRPTLPLTAAAFMGVNVVSNPQRPTYSRATARMHTGGPASAVPSGEAPEPTSRRT